MSEAMKALLAYQQADEDGVMVLASRQAIHEVAERYEALVKALSEALAVVQDCVGYSHSGDPWEENAFDMGELEIHDYAKDGRLEAARALLASASPPVEAKTEVGG